MADGNYSPAQIDNMSVWENVRGVDRKYTKPITGKSYKGDSVNPTYMVMRITEVLGPIGINWGYEVVSSEIHEGAVMERVPVEEHVVMRDTAPGEPPRAHSKTTRFELLREKWHICRIRMWRRGPDGSVSHWEHSGGTVMFTKFNSGKLNFDEDAEKKSITDALNKCLSQLGVCADVFLGLFDDKYQLPADQGPPPQQPPQQQLPPPQQPPHPGQQQISTNPENRYPPDNNAYWNPDVPVPQGPQGQRGHTHSNSDFGDI